VPLPRLPANGRLCREKSGNDHRVLGASVDRELARFVGAVNWDWDWETELDLAQCRQSMSVVAKQGGANSGANIYLGSLALVRREVRGASARCMVQGAKCKVQSAYLEIDKHTTRLARGMLLCHSCRISKPPMAVTCRYMGTAPVTAIFSSGVVQFCGLPRLGLSEAASGIRRPGVLLWSAFLLAGGAGEVASGQLGSYHTWPWPAHFYSHRTPDLGLSASASASDGHRDTRGTWKQTRHSEVVGA
jgi:hypothetical protein